MTRQRPVRTPTAMLRAVLLAALATLGLLGAAGAGPAVARPAGYTHPGLPGDPGAAVRQSAVAILAAAPTGVELGPGSRPTRPLASRPDRGALGAAAATPGAAGPTPGRYRWWLAARTAVLLRVTAGAAVRLGRAPPAGRAPAPPA